MNDVAIARGRGAPFAARARAPWPWRIATVLATCAAGGLLALVVAWWGWRWFGPSPPAASAPPPGPVVETIAAAALFGRARTAAPAAAGAPVATASALPADARLLGVFAGTDGTGYALLRLSDRGAVLAKTGQDVISGVTVEAVRPDGIRIRERGVARDIPLRAGAALATPAPAPGMRPSTAAAMATSRAACALPAGYSGPVYRLNAELLSGMAAQPQSWAALLSPASGALVVRDDTGLAAMLGMKAGDRLTQANGIALAAIDDVLAAIVKPLAASHPVRLLGARDGKPKEWLFLNAGACPA